MKGIDDTAVRDAQVIKAVFAEEHVVDIIFTTQLHTATLRVKPITGGMNSYYLRVRYPAGHRRGQSAG